MGAGLAPWIASYWMLGRLRRAPGGAFVLIGAANVRRDVKRAVGIVHRREARAVPGRMSKFFTLVQKSGGCVKCRPSYNNTLATQVHALVQGLRRAQASVQRVLVRKGPCAGLPAFTAGRSRSHTV